jgi:hypothetical protein
MLATCRLTIRLGLAIIAATVFALALVGDN